MSTTDISSMNYWYPRIKDLGVPTPKTEIPVTKNFWTWIEILDGKDPLSEEEKQQIRDAAIAVGGYPVFMRTDLCSGKHDYDRTCFVKDERALIRQIYALVENNAMHDLIFESLAIREYIEPAFEFKAFNGLPIAPERRYFVRDGEVVCRHPYWPEDSIHFWGNYRNAPEDWKSRLAEMNMQTGIEVMRLTEWSEIIARELDGEWSIDYMLGRSAGWTMIDMAEAHKSFHPKCEAWSGRRR